MASEKAGIYLAVTQTGGTRITYRKRSGETVVWENIPEPIDAVEKDLSKYPVPVKRE